MTERNFALDIDAIYEYLKDFVVKPERLWNETRTATVMINTRLPVKEIDAIKISLDPSYKSTAILNTLLKPDYLFDPSPQIQSILNNIDEHVEDFKSHFDRPEIEAYSKDEHVEDFKSKTCQFIPPEIKFQTPNTRLPSIASIDHDSVES